MKHISQQQKQPTGRESVCVIEIVVCMCLCACEGRERERKSRQRQRERADRETDTDNNFIIKHILQQQKQPAGREILECMCER